MRNTFRLIVAGNAQGMLLKTLLAVFVLSIFLSAPAKAKAQGNGCVPNTNPGACDDGTGATKCTKMKASEVHHLTVAGSLFQTTGACVYVTNATGTVKGDVILQSGAGGEAPIPIFSAGWAAAGLRNSSISWDSDWENTGSNAYAGSLLNAAGKMQAVIDWVYDNIRGTGATTPYCAWAGSAGSGAVLYALAEYGEGDSKLDHVQVQAATPFARIDVLCNPNVPNMETTLCPDVTNISPNHYPGPRVYLHNNDCDSSKVTQEELAEWAAMSIVNPNTEQTNYTKTTLSAFYCQNQPNFTVPQGTYFFGQNNTNITIDVPANFYNPDGTVYCPANTQCNPYLYCAPTTSTCVGEIAFQDPKVKALESDDMINNCISKHNTTAPKVVVVE